LQPQANPSTYNSQHKQTTTTPPSLRWNNEAPPRTASHPRPLFVFSRRVFDLRTGHSQSNEPFCIGKPSDSYHQDRVGVLNWKKNSKTGKRRERKQRKQREVTGTQVNRSVCTVCSKAFYHHLEFLEHAVSCSERYLTITMSGSINGEVILGGLELPEAISMVIPRSRSTSSKTQAYLKEPLPIS
jgi:hypothetical protein